MNKELIINASTSGVEIAFLEDKKLVELHSEKTDAPFAVGDLYLGKVKKLIPGLNAAFVDVGFEKSSPPEAVLFMAAWVNLSIDFTLGLRSV